MAEHRTPAYRAPMRMGPTLEPSGGGDEQLSVRTERPDPATTVLHVSGEVDMVTSSMLQTSIEQSLDAEPQLLVVDLEDVGFLGTSGLAALIQIRGQPAWQARSCDWRAPTGRCCGRSTWPA